MEVLPNLDASVEVELNTKERGVQESEAYLQSMVDGTRRIKPGRGRTTTAT
jgi:hypothetical protein